MSDNDFREVIDGEENKEPAASDNNLHTTEAESAEVVNTTADAQESDEKKDDEYGDLLHLSQAGAYSRKNDQDPKQHFHLS